MSLPTRYAQSDDVSIAYQVLGGGPIDLVFVMGWVTHLDLMWEEPRFARFLQRLAGFSRLILFDKRGTGGTGSLPRGVPTRVGHRHPSGHPGTEPRPRRALPHLVDNILTDERKPWGGDGADTDEHGDRHPACPAGHPRADAHHAPDGRPHPSGCGKPIHG